MNALNDDGFFKIFLPASVTKSKDPNDKKRWIQGIASTSSKDLQEEVVDQNGLDFSYFLEHGIINSDHNQGPEHIVGEPTEARVTKDGFWIKGFLYEGKEEADKWWEHLNSLERSGSSRRVGFSIEGKVKKRSGSRITACWIKNVAITASPVNTTTWAEIVKSLGACTLKEGKCDCGSCDVCKEKALSVGGMGSNLVPESLEGSNKVTTYKSLSDVPPNVSLSFDEYVTVLQLDKGWSKTVAKAVVDAIFIEKGLK